jgi:hypothetical protein
MENRFKIDSFEKLTKAANFYLEESFKYVNDILTEDLKKLVIIEQLKDVKFNDEDQKLIEEANIPIGSIDFLRSEKRIIHFLTVETLNKILNAHEVNIELKSKRKKILKSHIIENIQILGHIVNLGLFIEVLTNRHLLFLNHTGNIDNFIYNQLSEGKILNIIIFICRPEIEANSIKLDYIKHLFSYRNKAVHHTPKNSKELSVKVSDLIKIWNQVVELIELYEKREKFNENKFSSKVNFEKEHFMDRWF